VRLMDLSSPSFLSLSALELEADDSSVNTTRIVRVVKNREGGAASRTAPPPWPGLGQYCGESVMHSWSRCASAGDYAAASHLELLCSRWRPSACRHMEIDWGIGTGRRKGKTRQGSNRERGRDASANWVLMRGRLFARNLGRWIPMLGLHRALTVLGLHGCTDSSVCTRYALGEQSFRARRRTNLQI
jgi:hypothetical protein